MVPAAMKILLQTPFVLFLISYLMPRWSIKTPIITHYAERRLGLQGLMETAIIVWMSQWWIGVLAVLPKVSRLGKVYYAYHNTNVPE